MLYPEDMALIQSTFSLLFRLVVLVWGIHLLNVMTGMSLNKLFALYPRNPFGLIGIATSPFLHGDWGHIWSNTIAFLALGWLLIAQGYNLFIFVSIAVAIIGGLFTWLVEQRGVVGASGVIFGYFGFLLIYGFLSGNHFSTFATVLAGLAYGSMIFLALPLPDEYGISWKGHLGGFLGGLATGYFVGLLSYS